MEILLSKNDIDKRIEEVANQITKDYAKLPLTIVSIANGGIFFGADLARKIKLTCWCDVIATSSYDNDICTNVLKLRCQPKLSMKDRHILLVDEVLDSGQTLLKLQNYCLDLGALSVKTAVLVSKRIPRESGLQNVDYCCFELDDRYLIGYGMDSHEDYRNLDYIAAV